MSDPVSNSEIEDVLSSIRRLVAADGRGGKRSEDAAQTDDGSSDSPGTAPDPVMGGDKDALVLSPALRVEDEPPTSAQADETARWDADARAEAEATRDLGGDPVVGDHAQDEPDSPFGIEAISDDADTTDPVVTDTPTLVQSDPAFAGADVPEPDQPSESSVESVTFDAPNYEESGLPTPPPPGFDAADPLAASMDADETNAGRLPWETELSDEDAVASEDVSTELPPATAEVAQPSDPDAEADLSGLSTRIAGLEAALDETEGDWEPDGSEVAKPDEPMQWDMGESTELTRDVGDSEEVADSDIAPDPESGSASEQIGADVITPANDASDLALDAPSEAGPPEEELAAPQATEDEPVYGFSPIPRSDSDAPQLSETGPDEAEPSVPTAGTEASESPADQEMQTEFETDEGAAEMDLDHVPPDAESKLDRADAASDVEEAAVDEILVEEAIEAEVTKIADAEIADAVEAELVEDAESEAIRPIPEVPQPDPTAPRLHLSSAASDQPILPDEGEEPWSATTGEATDFDAATPGSAENVFDEDVPYLDEDTLRDMVSDIVRQELQGALGERITRNVRKLVRREIHRALASRDFD